MLGVAGVQERLAITQALAKDGGPEVKLHWAQAGKDVIESEMARAQKALSIEREVRDEGQKRNRGLIESIKLRDQELQKAKDALATERERDTALRASIGALNAGESRRLERATASAEAGTLTRRQAEDLKELGGEAGSKIAEEFYAKLADPALVERLSKLIGDPLKRAQDEFERRQKDLDKETGGKSASTRVRELEKEMEDLNSTFEEGVRTLSETMRKLIDLSKKNEAEIAKARLGATSGR
jgi:hypothetical protein